MREMHKRVAMVLNDHYGNPDDMFMSAILICTILGWSAYCRDMHQFCVSNIYNVNSQEYANELAKCEDVEATCLANPPEQKP